MKHYPLIRTIYLYLFTLVGLALLIIGGVRFVEMGLKAFVFTKAEQEQRILYQTPPYPSLELEKIAKVGDEKIEEKEGEITLSQEEKARIDQWIVDYNDWKERRAKIDPVTTRRHRDASLNLALILIGFPLYLYHWLIIKRETKDKKGRNKSLIKK